MKEENEKKGKREFLDPREENLSIKCIKMIIWVKKKTLMEKGKKQKREFFFFSNDLSCVHV